jgi:uncharacterized protein (TIGR02611 family)
MEPRSPRVRRLRARRERHLERSRAYRIAFAVAGFAVLITGLAGLALPILPGWALIFVGLFMLGLEFAWAEHLLERASDRFDRLRHRGDGGATRE